MHHVITVADVLKVSGITLIILSVIGGFCWFVSKIDFSK
jgi:hypothetical protein